MEIRDWIDSILKGPGGLHSYEEHEGYYGDGPNSRDTDVAAWVLRCLANPECKGSWDVLLAINERRELVINKG